MTQSHTTALKLKPTQILQSPNIDLDQKQKQIQQLKVQTQQVQQQISKLTQYAPQYTLGRQQTLMSEPQQIRSDLPFLPVQQASPLSNISPQTQYTQPQYNTQQQQPVQQYSQQGAFVQPPPEIMNLAQQVTQPCIVYPSDTLGKAPYVMPVDPSTFHQQFPMNIQPIYLQNSQIQQNQFQPNYEQQRGVPQAQHKFVMHPDPNVYDARIPEASGQLNYGQQYVQRPSIVDQLPGDDPYTTGFYSDEENQRFIQEQQLKSQQRKFKMQPQQLGNKQKQQIANAYQNSVNYYQQLKGNRLITGGQQIPYQQYPYQRQQNYVPTGAYLPPSKQIVSKDKLFSSPEFERDLEVDSQFARVPGHGHQRSNQTGRNLAQVAIRNNPLHSSSDGKAFLMQQTNNEHKVLNLLTKSITNTTNLNQSQNQFLQVLNSLEQMNQNI